MSLDRVHISAARYIFSAQCYYGKKRQVSLERIISQETFERRIIMKKIFSILFFLVLVFLFAPPICTYSQELQAIELPKPQMNGGRPLMEVLKDRKSTREFGSEKLPDQLLSNLLWAAWGLNRPFKGSGIKAPGSRTAPSGHNWQDIDIYVAMAEGLYLYNAIDHVLKPIHKRDIRVAAAHPVQMFVKDAPVILIYVSDLSKFTDMPPGNDCEKEFIPFAHTGFISQNAYLYCASEGLATVVRFLFDKIKLGKEMGLRDDQFITLTQLVGYPKKVMKTE
jgi:nitroreductase